MKKEIVVSVFVASVVVSFIAGYATSSGRPVTSKKKITIVDDAGRCVEVSHPLENLVVLHSDAGEIICALGVENKVVGVDSLTKKKLAPKFDQIPEVGSAYKPTYEKIIELEPEVVVTYSGSIGLEVGEKLNPYGIAVVCLDPYKIETIAGDVKILGLMLDRAERADEYVNFFERYLEIIKNRVGGLKPEDKVRVYLEGYGDYKTVAADTGGHKMIVMAGGINIAAGEPVPYPSISAEWILHESPQVIIKATGSKVLPKGGRGTENAEPLMELREEIVNRSGWSEIDAVKNEKVYMIAWDIYGGPSQVVSIYYMAKWFYPHLFEDFDPESIHKEMLENFMGLEYKGVLVYP